MPSRRRFWPVFSLAAFKTAAALMALVFLLGACGGGESTASLDNTSCTDSSYQQILDWTKSRRDEINEAYARVAEEIDSLCSSAKNSRTPQAFTDELLALADDAAAAAEEEITGDISMTAFEEGLGNTANAIRLTSDASVTCEGPERLTVGDQVPCDITANGATERHTAVVDNVRGYVTGQLPGYIDGYERP
jgi:hypothetical protein